MAFRGRAAFPGSDQGYTRPGNDFLYGGSGSGMGVPAQGTASLGQGLGPITGMAGGWEPSVLYLLFLVIAEMIAVHLLSRMLK